MMLWSILFLFITELYSTLGAPFNLQICNRNDSSKMNDCLKSATENALLQLKNGIPDLRVPPLEPLLVPSVSIKKGKRINVVQHFTNMKIYGLSSSKINRVRLALTPKNFELNIHAHALKYRVQADYDFPVVGQGPCNITAVKPKIDFAVSGAIKEEKGEEYLNAERCSIAVHPKEVTYKFDNLFGGDTVLQHRVNNILNENWKEIFEDVRSGYEEMLASVICNYANKIFSKISLNRIFPK